MKGGLLWYLSDTKITSTIPDCMLDGHGRRWNVQNIDWSGGGSITKGGRLEQLISRVNLNQSTASATVDTTNLDDELRALVAWEERDVDPAPLQRRAVLVQDGVHLCTHMAGIVGESRRRMA